MAQFIGDRIVLGPDDGAVIAALRAAAASTALRLAQQTKSAQPAISPATRQSA